MAARGRGEHPEDLLRGLFHSDGARIDTWATRQVRGEQRRYEYARWMFVNRSQDILQLCTETQDLVGVAWQSHAATTYAASTR